MYSFIAFLPCVFYGLGIIIFGGVLWIGSSILISGMEFSVDDGFISIFFF
jgi:hypothetical protein